MSNEIKKNKGRPYQLKARAKRQDLVHHRITLAAVELHGTVGPAKTTMNAIADLAGVRRATVYNHFPSDYELIDACSSHWMMENPPPDTSDWTKIEDLAIRLNTALHQYYSYYNKSDYMLGKIMKDAPQIPALQKILDEKWNPMIENLIQVLTIGYNPDNIEKIKATIRIALDFNTWKKFNESGVSDEEAASIATAWINAFI